MEDKELDEMINKVQTKYARLFTTALKRQAEGSFKNIKVIVDKKNMFEAMPFKTITNVSFGIFQDLGTGKKSGNPKKKEMYKKAESQLSRTAPPIARRFSNDNTGGIKASFYQSIPANLFKRYEQEVSKTLIKYTQDLVKNFPNV